MSRPKGSVDKSQRKYRVKITAEIKRSVLLYYHSMPINKIAAMLGISRESIINIANELRLKKIGSYAKYAVKEGVYTLANVSGVFIFSNSVNDKIYVDASTDVGSTIYEIYTQLNKNIFPIENMQNDWTMLTEQAFTVGLILRCPPSSVFIEKDKYLRGLPKDRLYTNV